MLDPAGNSTTSAPITVNVDNHAPTPTLNNPGSDISGTPTLSVTTDADTATVDFQEMPQGGSSWTTIATVGPPFTTPFDTTTLSDGSYILRAVATDLAGHVGTSPTVTVLVDNTKPTGSFTQPLAGQTIGGPAAQLAATASDSGSGIASVQFEYSPAGLGTWSPIATVTSAPYQTTWDASAVPTANYDLRLVITDNAGNVKTTAPMTVHVDSTAPTVNLTNPGALISGTVGLTATTSGPVATSVTFQVSPAGANTWQTISVDHASPWSASFDTTTLGDGLYDLRALAVDSLGNQGTDVQAGIRIDNTPPSIVSSIPADGATVSSANDISFDASEIVTLSGVTLDGIATVAPTITNMHVDFATGALTDGPHTLAGTLVDAVGKQTPFRIHFTVYPTATTPAPYTEKNASLAHSTTLGSADGDTSFTMPANAWSGGNPSDWLVIRVTPETTASAPATTIPLATVVDASAYWALAGGQVHSFQQPLDITLDNVASGAEAATYNGTAWQMIQAVPTPGTLPAGWSDGYYVSGSTMHILTRHLSLFAATQQITPPAAPAQPKNVTASVNNGDLIFYWAPGASDAANFVFSIDGKPVANLGGTEFQYDTGPFDPNDSHTYSIVEVDSSGNASDPVTLKVVPNVIGMSLDAARAALLAAGFTVGDITVANSTSPDGTVIGPSILVAALGSAIPLQLSGGSNVNPKFGFTIVDAKGVPLAQRKFVGVYFFGMTAPTNVTAQLYGPHHKLLRTWHTVTRGKIAIRKLVLPKSARKPGLYTLRTTAVSGANVAHRTTAVRVYKSLAVMQRALAKHRIDIVIAGTKLPKQLPTSLKVAQRFVSGDETTSFVIAASKSRNVQIIVVDADEYGARMVHNLRLVFPGIKIIAIANDPTKAARARANGATVTLRGTTTGKLAKIVSQLATPVRLPQTPRR